MIRQEQCDKVCRVLDDVLANRPTERDSLIIATRKAFEALEGAKWIPCSEETGDGYPEEDGFYYVTEQNYYKQRVTHTSHFKNGDFTDRFYDENYSNIIAWMPLPEPYKEEQE